MGKIKTMYFKVKQWKHLRLGKKAGARDPRDAKIKKDSEGCTCVKNQAKYTSVMTALSEIHRGEVGRGYCEKLMEEKAKS